VSDGLLPALVAAPLYCYPRKLFIPVSTCPSSSVARDDNSVIRFSPCHSERASAREDRTGEDLCSVLE
jgi:hypothetical protein